MNVRGVAAIGKHRQPVKSAALKRLNFEVKLKGHIIVALNARSDLKDQAQVLILDLGNGSGGGEGAGINP